MELINDFPEQVQEIENVWIPMSDGIKLAARLWLPSDAAEHKRPVIFEYIPYRKRDLKRTRDETMHRYFAGYGYAAIRVDIRGSGDSEGLIHDEYLEQELSDGEEVIAWLREQPWCDGRVGMIGISWGGFNGLQIAARRPRGLNAVVSVCSTDDRYADDVHYMGGCLLGDNLSWSSVMFGKNSTPPDPEIVGDRWRDMWLSRLNNNDPWILKWLDHQKRDDYWKHGSVCENWEDINIPVMAVSGWADGYTNSVFRIVENLKAPAMGLVGPWSHKYPHEGVPGPAIGFLQECMRWWDRWLKGEPNDIEKEPKLKAWIQKSVPPFTSYNERPGYWCGFDQWPSNAVNDREMFFDTYKLTDKKPQENEVYSFKSPLRLGLYAGKWCSYSAPPDLPGDQREEDGGALVFNSDPLEEEITIFGQPRLKISFKVKKPVALLAVRLSDIDEEGKATRVTYGVKNLTHLNSHENPISLEEDKLYTAEIALNDTGHVFPKGHRIRVALSSSYWPLIWVPPELCAIEIHTISSSFSLPVKEKNYKNDVEFERPESAASTTNEIQLGKPDVKWQVKRDLIEDKSTLQVLHDKGTIHFDSIDLNISENSCEEYSICDDVTDSAEGKVEGVFEFQRKDWHVKTYHKTILTSDKDNFYVNAQLDAYENSTRIFSKNWNRQIPRNHL
jgi:hypothetical protein